MPCDYELECYSATEGVGGALVPSRSMGSVLFVTLILFSGHQEIGENVKDTFLSSIPPHHRLLLSWVS